MNKEEFDLKLQQFLNNQVYIMAYRFNYDSARIFNDELIEYIKQLQQENKQLKDKIEYLKEQKENKNKWLQLIADIGYDYDGFNTVDSLNGLIDELVKYALYARDNDSYENFVLKGDSNE